MAGGIVFDNTHTKNIVSASFVRMTDLSPPTLVLIVLPSLPFYKGGNGLGEVK